MCVWTELYTKLITEEFESRFDIRNATQLNSNASRNPIDNNLRKKKLFRTNSFTTNNLCQQQTKNTISLTNLRKIKSDSDLLSSLQKSKNHLNEDQLPTLNKLFQQLRDVNFRYTDQRLDPQPITTGIKELNLNGKTTGCKFESKANGFLNCDSEKLIQYQVPLSVLTKIAQIANNNPDSSLMYSILTYVNTLHTFSVK